MTETLSYRNQSTDLQRKSMDWFLYDWDLRHEKINSITSEIVKIGVFKTRLLVRKIFHRPGLFWQLFSFLFFFFFVVIRLLFHIFSCSL